MVFLVDHNIEGYALILFEMGVDGWLNFLPIRFIMFPEANLSVDSDDQVVWRFAQSGKSTDTSYS